MRQATFQTICSEHPGMELRCCYSEPGKETLWFGFLRGGEVCHSPHGEVFQMTAYKPVCYVHGGQYLYYLSRAFTTDDMLARLDGVAPDARIEVACEDGRGGCSCCELHEVLATRTMLVLYLPTRRKFMEGVTTPDHEFIYLK